MTAVIHIAGPDVRVDAQLRQRCGGSFTGEPVEKWTGLML